MNEKYKLQFHLGQTYRWYVWILKYDTIFEYMAFYQVCSLKNCLKNKKYDQLQ